MRLIDADALIRKFKTASPMAIDGRAKQLVEDMPTIEPERLTDDDVETIRIHLSAFKEKLCNQGRYREAEEYQRLIDRFMAFTSAYSDVPAINAVDTISRQAAIDVLNSLQKFSLIDSNEYLHGVGVRLKFATQKLEQLPSAQPVQKIGHWIREGQEGFSGYCSVCGHDLPLFRKEWTEWEYVETPYCPNCGAKMEGKQ